MKKQTSYNYFIDLLKFIFSVIIVFYHSWIFTGEYGAGFFNHGYLAVDFYFIVTGYLMMQSIAKEKETKEALGLQTLKFVYKKIASLFPYILFSFILGCILIYKSDILSLSVVTSNNLVSEILQIGVLGLGYPINGATWYLSSMLIVLMCLYPLAKKYKTNYQTLVVPLLLALVLCLVYSSGMVINDPANKVLFGLNGLYKGFIFILLGNISYSIVSWLEKFEFTKCGKILLTICEFILLFLLITTMHYNLFGTIVVALITLMLVTLVFSGKSYTKKMFNLPFLKKLGFFGFIMYLNNVYLRGPLLNSGLDISYKEYVLLFLGITFAISLLTYYIVPLFVKILKNILVFLKSKLICE